MISMKNLLFPSFLTGLREVPTLIRAAISVKLRQVLPLKFHGC